MKLLLRKAQAGDFESFYWLKADKVNIEWSGHEQAPEKESFSKWFQAQLSSMTRTIYLVVDEEGGKVLGYCYVDKLEENTYDIGYGVHSFYAGHGIATFMIGQVVEIVRENNGEKITAWISIKNIGSRTVINHNGFIETTETEQRRLPLLPKINETFSLWVKEL